jgi:DnaJ family protein C protein 7
LESAAAAAAVEVKKAYRRAALRLHPDKAVQALPSGMAAACGLDVALREDSERLFRLASDAHDCLSDAVARKKYDQAEASEAALRRAQAELELPPPLAAPS